MNRLKYRGCSILCKHVSMEGETRERAKPIQRRKVVGSVECMMKVRTVDLEVKKELCDGRDGKIDRKLH